MSWLMCQYHPGRRSKELFPSQVCINAVFVKDTLDRNSMAQGALAKITTVFSRPHDPHCYERRDRGRSLCCQRRPNQRDPLSQGATRLDHMNSTPFQHHFSQRYSSRPWTGSYRSYPRAADVSGVQVSAHVFELHGVPVIYH